MGEEIQVPACKVIHIYKASAEHKWQISAFHCVNQTQRKDYATSTLVISKASSACRLLDLTTIALLAASWTRARFRIEACAVALLVHAASFQ